ncbi:hypothetical protein FC34_GL001640 [Lacticaseibacillus brantae DSM 23927]|uniref:DUF1827 domain-containing protein n=1 Tax=Lacticaseibacillus brantae DSM 23927 TaxID=1423727 RepID=A0A0R2AXM9_9LACO|nr:hypothetical protein FC34_GL001640 [Lacticaseibacillus brantae DSM 23927]
MTILKLIENPIRLNASLHKMIPYTVRHLYGKQPIKLYRNYTLGATHVYYIDAFNRIDVVMTNTHRNIKQDQVDFVVERLFPDVAVDELTIDQLAKAEIESEVHHKLKVKDLVIISQSKAQTA